MARIRTVKPEFWEDETTTSLSRDARLLFIATFNYADDEGLLRWSPEKLKAAAFMYDDDISVRDVDRLMGELVEARLIQPYQGKSSHLAWIVNFHRHQRINRPQPSKLPSPNLQNRVVASTYADRDGWTCHLCDGPVNQRPATAPDPYAADGPPDISTLNASLDHVVPKSQGGTDYPSNIRLAHVGCNKGRRNRPVDDFTTPQTVAKALGHVLTSDDADSVIVLAPFSESAVNVHEPITDVLPPEREKEREGEQRNRGKGTGEQSADADNDAFDKFWEAYGKKVDRAKAVKAFKAATKNTDADIIIKAAFAHAMWHERAGTEPKFIKHAASWLNAEGWLDERPEPRAPRAVQSTTDDRVRNTLAIAERLRAQEQANPTPQIGRRA